MFLHRFQNQTFLETVYVTWKPLSVFASRCFYAHRRLRFRTSDLGRRLETFVLCMCSNILRKFLVAFFAVISNFSWSVYMLRICIGHWTNRLFQFSVVNPAGDFRADINIQTIMRSLKKLAAAVKASVVFNTWRRKMVCLQFPRLDTLVCVFLCLFSWYGEPFVTLKSASHCFFLISQNGIHSI